MAETDVCTFRTELLRPAKPGKGDSWAFLVLPKTVSDTLPRRGRTSVEGTINGCPFHATLDPDGRLSYWLKVDEELRDAAGAKIGDMVTVEVSPVAVEQEPRLTDDLTEALAVSPAATAVSDATTTYTGLQWINGNQHPQ